MVILKKLSRIRWLRVWTAAWACVWLSQVGQGVQEALCESKAALLFSAQNEWKARCECCCKDAKQEAFPHAYCQTEQGCSGTSIPGSQEPVFTPTVSTQQFPQVEYVSKEAFSPESFHRLTPSLNKPCISALQLYLLNQILLI